MAVFSGNGAVGSPSFTFSSDTNTGMYRVDADKLGLVTNGTNALTIDSSQRVGIGTNSPSDLLHLVGGNLRFTGIANSGSTIFREVNFVNLGTTTTPGAKIVATTGGTSGIHELGFYTTANNASTVTEKLRIVGDGRIGMGVSNPAAALHISRSGEASQILERSSDVVANAGSLTVRMAGQDLASIVAERTDVGGRGTALEFSTAQVSTGTLTERMRLTSSGSFLFGGTLPSSPNATISSSGAISCKGSISTTLNLSCARALKVETSGNPSTFEFVTRPTIVSTGTGVQKNNGETLDTPSLASNAFVGLLFVTNTRVSNAAVRTSTIFFISGRFTAAATITPISTVDGTSGASPFTITNASTGSANILRYTNNDTELCNVVMTAFVTGAG